MALNGVGLEFAASHPYEAQDFQVRLRFVEILRTPWLRGIFIIVMDTQCVFCNVASLYVIAVGTNFQLHGVNIMKPIRQ
jgi:hypothetical protein